ncbi:MAG: DUF2073 domain-containing protein [Nanoarchaeota archaeon]|nr:DUF2073 domain-containing protein [Nanoarchaeota archaeon]
MLTLQFIPYSEIGSLDSEQKINKLLRLAKEDKIVVVEGKLKAEEEAKLIQKTMEQINSKFKGLEICDVNSDAIGEGIMNKLRNGIARLLIGERMGMTIIGPASVIKEIKKDPNKIRLFTKDVKKRRGRGKIKGGN